MAKINNVLIAEDDSIYRAHLAASIDWEELGCRIMQTVPDGESAYRVLQTERVDILITDVKMPKLNGVDLIVKARALRPDIKILVLSSFDNFDYVRESLKNGAADYLLKHKAGGTALRQIIEKMSARSDPPKDSASSGTVPGNQMAREELKRVLNGDSTAEGLEMVARSLKRSSGFDALLVVVFKIDHYQDLLSALPSETPVARFLTTLLDVVEDAVQAPSMVTAVTENRFALVSLVPHTRSRAIAEAQAGDIMRQVSDVTHRFFGLTVKWAGADAVLSSNDLSVAWLEALQRLESKSFQLGKITPVPVSGESWYSDRVSLSVEEEESVIGAIMTGDGKKAFGLADTILRSAANGGVSREGLLFLANELVGIIIRVCRNQGVDPTEFVIGTDLPTQALAAADDLDELIHYVGGGLAALAEAIMPDRGVHPVARQARAYLRENFHDPIGLVDVAEHLQVSTSHLSRTFKSEFGHGLSEELNQLRLEHARRLLENSDLAVKQIARRCGFASYNYFFSAFRRDADCTPQEFRRKTGRR